MSNLDYKLFTDEKDWLAGTYKTSEVAFVVSEYFARYVRKRWPDTSASSPSGRGHLYLEFIDVEFHSAREVPRKLVKLGYASDTLQILIPDNGYSEEQKESLRDFYQLKYAPILKESHARTNALLWQTFSEDERAEILSMFKENTTLESDIKKAIVADLDQENSKPDAQAIKMQARRSGKISDDGE